MTNCAVLFMDFRKPSSLPSYHLEPPSQSKLAVRGPPIPAGLIRLEAALRKGSVQRFSPLANVQRCEAEPQTLVHRAFAHRLAAGDVRMESRIIVFC